MRYQGRITTWKDDKGFGFITPNGGGDQVFLHISAFSQRQQRPTGDELVTYERKVDAKGRAQAVLVAYVGEPSAPGHSRTLPIFAAVFMIFIIGSVVVGRLPLAVLTLYLVTSVIAFFAYAFDKSAARKGQWRTQESTLHLLAIVGGWPGALTAQRLHRHKSSKSSFQRVFWVTVGLNCGALAWLMSPAGSRLLKSALGIA